MYLEVRIEMLCHFTFKKFSAMIFLSQTSALDGRLLIFISEEFSTNDILYIYLLAGKLNRGLSVVDSYKLLQGRQLTDDEVFLACVLGWCIEWVGNRIPPLYFVKAEAFSQVHNHTSVSLLLHDNLCLLFYATCSFKHISLCLMILWITRIHVEVNLAGSGFPRCKPIVTLFFFTVQACLQLPL